MKKFSFSMQRLLDAREALRSAREMELYNMRQRLRSEEDRLKEIVDRLQSAMFNAPDLNTVGITWYRQREVYLARLREMKRMQEYRVNEARTRVESALSALKEAMTELKKMEKVREKEQAGWTLEFRRDEQKNNDEVASVRSNLLRLAGSYE